MKNFQALFQCKGVWHTIILEGDFMCGIVAYLGKNVKKTLIEGLRRLEYRGYDSAGMTVKQGKKFENIKAVGSVDNLEKILGRESGSLGIAHTRWATHGGITIENAHPHFSSDGQVALVHNGIIENFRRLKDELTCQGKTFYGQTDSEVVAKLFDEELSLERLYEVAQKLEGSYALALTSTKENKIYFAKQKSPLYVAFENGEGMISSDPSTFVGFSKRYFSLEDGEYGVLDKNGVKFLSNGRKIDKKVVNLDFNFTSSSKENYPHYMIKEIYESGFVLANLLQYYQNKSVQEEIKKIDLQKFDKIYLIGCGTAFHAGLMGEHEFLSRFDKMAMAIKASEVKNHNYNFSHSLCFFVSQSGETADTICAQEYIKSHGGKTIAIVNTPYSTLARLCDKTFPICAGQEKAVASTKAYIGQCVTLKIIAMVLAGEDFTKPLKEFINSLNYGDEEKILKLSSFLKKTEKSFFIGRGKDYITALEASLKLKEITYIFSSAEYCGELKHGSLALVEEGMFVFLICLEKKFLAKNISTACEVASRGGRVVFVTPFANEIESSDEFKSGQFDLLKISACPDIFMDMQAIISLQKLAYFTSISRGVNPDKPRNLAKSVTVE